MFRIYPFLLLFIQDIQLQEMFWSLTSIWRCLERLKSFSKSQFLNLVALVCCLQIMLAGGGLNFLSQIIVFLKKLNLFCWRINKRINTENWILCFPSCVLWNVFFHLVEKRREINEKEVKMGSCLIEGFMCIDTKS